MSDTLVKSDTAVLDTAHIGDIEGAFGTIARGDNRQNAPWGRRLATLFAILGPGLIVMIGDNDAGAFSTYTQAGQNYGTSLLWTLLLLIPVLYVNQEMVLRLGAVTGVGHARLIMKRFGRFWGAFSVIDLFILNGLTIVTEFIGINLALGYLGVPRGWGLLVAATIIIGAAMTGSFRRFERFSLMLCGFSLLLIPVFWLAHPPLAQIGHDLIVPSLPGGDLVNVILMIVGIVGTTVAPWQLFFQQSYVIDKRITTAFIGYEKIDLTLGIVAVVVGGVAMMGCAAVAFSGTAQFGQFTDAGAVAAGLEAYGGRLVGALFAIALLDASIIGAAAVSLSTAYALGDVFAVSHSLHRKATTAKTFYTVYAALIAGAALLVQFGNNGLLGLVTNAVQVLAGVMLPSATVFLLLLCNDQAVLGPWANGRKLNIFTGAVIWTLVLLSIVLTASTLFPEISETMIIGILSGGSLVGILGGGLLLRSVPAVVSTMSHADRAAWRMPSIEQLAPAQWGIGKRVWMGTLRAYLVVAMIMVAVKAVQMAFYG